MNSFEDDYELLSGVFLTHAGCLLSPWFLGGQWDILRAECAKIIATPPKTIDERAAVERRLHEIVILHVYNPNVRAFEVHRAQSLPHLREFSHLLERSVFHYMKGDFLSTILVGLPAVEGMLRSYCGWQSNQPPLSKAAIKERLQAAQPKTDPAGHSLYSRRLIEFHDKWLWSGTSQADFGLSFLNRHYVLHGLGQGRYYRAFDCNRLLLFFDLFAEIVAHEQGYDDCFIPTGVAAIDQRREYYGRLSAQTSPIRSFLKIDPLMVHEAADIEQRFLSEHQNYYTEQDPIVLEQVLTRFSDVMGLP
jgi:hypothetical protein